MGKIKTKGNCYFHRLLHPWGVGGRGDTLSNQNSNEKYKNTSNHIIRLNHNSNGNNNNNNNNDDDDDDNDTYDNNAFT